MFDALIGESPIKLLLLTARSLRQDKLKKTFDGVVRCYRNYRNYLGRDGEGSSGFFRPIDGFLADALELLSIPLVGVTDIL